MIIMMIMMIMVMMLVVVVVVSMVVVFDDDGALADGNDVVACTMELQWIIQYFQKVTFM